MKTTKNTVLITGGSAGIGLEIAKKLSAAGNQVIITGRDAARLERAVAQLKNVIGIRADISNSQDVRNLVERVTTEFPALNLVINNAGAAFIADLKNDQGLFDKAAAEMLTNYLSVIRLNEGLLPTLLRQPDAALVMVSSIVAFVPGSRLATYAASKAALHSYSQSLRVALEGTPVRVFELMPPLVNTEFSAEIGGHNGIPASQVAGEFLEGLENDNYEIRVAGTEQLYRLFLSSPEEALKAMNARNEERVGA